MFSVKELMGNFADNVVAIECLPAQCNVRVLSVTVMNATGNEVPLSCPQICRVATK